MFKPKWIRGFVLLSVSIASGCQTASPPPHAVTNSEEHPQLNPQITLDLLVKDSQEPVTATVSYHSPNIIHMNVFKTGIEINMKLLDPNGNLVPFSPRGKVFHTSYKYPISSVGLYVKEGEPQQFQILPLMYFYDFALPGTYTLKSQAMARDGIAHTYYITPEASTTFEINPPK